jgi:hypothetical protein
MLMGYTAKNVRSMITSIKAVHGRMVDGVPKDNLEMAYEFLEGLLEEGRV